MDSNREPRLELLAQSLDLDVSDWASFEAVVTLLTAKQDWKQLERAHRVMLRLVPAAAGEKVGERPKKEVERELWLALMRIYRDGAGNLPSAITVLELLVNHYPANEDVAFDLATLLEETDQLDRAVATYESVVWMNPSKVEAYQRLFDIHMHRRALDAAWCTASALVPLGRLDGAGRDFYEDHLPRRVGRRGEPLPEEAWSLLRHEDDDERVSAILRAVAPTLAYPPVAIAQPPAFDPEASLDTLHGGSRLQDLLYFAGREAAYQREPELAKLVRGRSVHRLTVLFLGAAKSVSPDIPAAPPLADEVNAAAAEFRRTLDPAASAAVRRALVGIGKIRIGRWRDAMVLTAMRAGLLYAGDANVVRKILSAEPRTSTELSTPDHHRDLLPFAVSKKHIELRAMLGRGVGSGE